MSLPVIPIQEPQEPQPLIAPVQGDKDKDPEQDAEPALDWEKTTAQHKHGASNWIKEAKQVRGKRSKVPNKKYNDFDTSGSKPNDEADD